MLTDPNETKMICEKCGQTAFQRTVDVRHGSTTRRIVYVTHHRVGHSKHHEALGRIEKFHERFHKLEADLNALPKEKKKLSSGWITGFEFGSVKPNACGARTHFVATATIHAWKQDEEVELDAQELKGQSVAKLLREFKKKAEPVIQRMKAQFDVGDF